VTPDEALLHLRTTVPDAIDTTIAEGLPSDALRGQLKDLGAKMRAATDIDTAAALDEQVAKVAQREPRVYQRIEALTKDVRDQAEAETIPGQIRQAAKDASKAVDTGLKVVEAVAIGYILWKIIEHTER
jgi:hypothetical protein